MNPDVYSHQPTDAAYTHHHTSSTAIDDLIYPMPLTRALGAVPEHRAMSASTKIGNVYRANATGTYLFQCCHRACSHTSFRRVYDVSRRHDSKHATARPQFWCTVGGCDRSAVVGDRPFPRKDKLKDHVRKVHGGMDGT
jgi:hypothetical protein